MARVFYHFAVQKAFLIRIQEKLEVKSFHNKIKQMEKLRIEEKWEGKKGQ